MKKILSLSEIKVYSRKEIIAWVQQGGNYSFEELRNGLFFIKILKKLVPEDMVKYKTHDKPVNQYEQTLNMNFVKKTLNKHGLQLNMNVQQIVASKNCFELANWFRNLYDQNKSDNDTEFHYSERNDTPSKFQETETFTNIAQYKSLTRVTSTDKMNTVGDRKLGRVTSGFIDIHKGEINFNLTCKIPKPAFDSDMNYQINSNSRLGSKLERSRTVKFENKGGKSIGKIAKKTSSNWLSNTQQKLSPKKITEEERVLKLMKIEALEDSIECLEETIKKVANFLKNGEENGDLEKTKNEIISLIYQIAVEDN